MTDRLDAQFAFLNEADRLKSVLRATTLVDGSRPENSGEHSWHLALYALVLADQAGPGVDINRVIRMLLIHDLVEIDVGDVPIHSQNGTADKVAPPKDTKTLVGKLHEQKGITISHEQIEGAGHFFENDQDHMNPMIATVQDYVRRRLGETSR